MKHNNDMIQLLEFRKRMKEVISTLNDLKDEYEKTDDNKDELDLDNNEEIYRLALKSQKKMN
jgi:hypothetical protein